MAGRHQMGDDQGLYSKYLRIDGFQFAGVFSGMQICAQRYIYTRVVAYDVLRGLNCYNHRLASVMYHVKLGFFLQRLRYIGVQSVYDTTNTCET